MMKTLLLSLSLLWASHSLASAWAILLNQPSVVYLAPANQDDIKTLESAMADLNFEGGIVHVSAPNPTRNLRFNAPGQRVAELLPRFRKMGFEIDLAFSKATSPKNGFIISQNEVNPKQLSIVVNTGYEGFQLEKLTIKLPAIKMSAKELRVD